MNVEIIKSARAWSYLDDWDFLQAWSSLAKDCPWATVFQSVDFCKTWYECYSDVRLPLFVIGTHSGQLVGLLPLAVSKGGNHVAWAGEYHAEYHAWLAIPAFSEQFIERAFDALSSEIPRGSLTFVFAAPGTPTKWFERPGRWRGRTVVRKVERPFFAIDPAVVDDSLRKKSNRSKLNRLRKVGELEFKVLQTGAELEKIFDEVMLFKRYRHLAVHGQERPVLDRRKRTFYLQCMERGLLHATVVTLSGRLLSAHIGIRNKSEVLLGILAYSPFFAAHSPGKMHIAMLTNKLREEGVTSFDLTPGGEYKERFANGADEVYWATLFCDRRDYLAFKLKQEFKRWGKQVLGRTGSSPSSLLRNMMRIQSEAKLHAWTGLLQPLMATLRQQMWSTREYRVYRMAPEDAVTPLKGMPVRRDSLEDLLAFSPGDPRRMQFMEQSLKMIENGAHPYTLVENEELIHCTWVAQASESDLPKLCPNWRPPAGAVVLDISHLGSRTVEPELHHRALCEIVREAAAIPGTEHLFAAISKPDELRRKIIEQLGFRHEYSFFDARRLGRSKSWTGPSVRDYAEAASGLDGTRRAAPFVERRRGKNSLIPKSQPSNSIADKYEVSTSLGNRSLSASRVVNPTSQVTADSTPHSRSHGNSRTS